MSRRQAPCNKKAICNIRLSILSIYLSVCLIICLLGLCLLLLIVAACCFRFTSCQGERPMLSCYDPGSCRCASTPASSASCFISLSSFQTNFLFRPFDAYASHGVFALYPLPPRACGRCYHAQQRGHPQHLLVCPLVCMFVSMFVCLSVSLSICLLVCLPHKHRA